MLIIIDKREFEYHDNIIAGKELKVLAGVSCNTIQEDGLIGMSDPTEEHWGVWQLISGPEPDIRIKNDDVIKLSEYKYHRHFFTGSLAINAY